MKAWIINVVEVEILLVLFTDGSLLRTFREQENVMLSLYELFAVHPGYLRSSPKVSNQWSENNTLTEK